jgi:hydroxymethylpyrimidine/phosphomethylpyrimidine kinase
MLRHVAVITPNLAEAEALTGLTVRDVEGMKAAAKRLCEMGAAAALVKGGHLKGESSDVLFDGKDWTVFPNDLRPREYHGTGCVLASALAANLARGLDLAAAVEKARHYLRRCIEGARPGKGESWLLAFPPADD